MFRPELWWWEITVAMRKITIVLLGVFGTNMGEMQVHITAWSIVVVMLVTVKLQPYGKRTELMFLEMFALVMIWMSLWSASVFNAYPRCEDPRVPNVIMGWCDFMSILIGIGNICVLLVALVIMAYYSTTKLAKKVNKMLQKRERQRSLAESQTKTDQTSMRKRMNGSFCIDNPTVQLELQTMVSDNGDGGGIRLGETSEGEVKTMEHGYDCPSPLPPPKNTHKLLLTETVPVEIEKEIMTHQNPMRLNNTSNNV